MYKLAVADDHEIFRRGLKALLSTNSDFQIDIEASDGKELITKLSGAEVLPSVCILDVSMPVMNGYETMRCINKKWPHLKVLALSMYGNETSIINMIRSGARGYVLKGSPSEEIEQAIMSVIEDGYYHSGINSLLLSTLIQNKNNSALDLSPNELKFLELVCSDRTYSDIADIMSISARTVDGYRDSLFKKFNVKKRTSLAIRAMQIGLLPEYSS